MSEVPTMAELDKIDGIDRYEVENAARTLIEAKQLKKKPKLYNAAIKEVARQATAAQQALLEAKVSKKLSKVYEKK